MDMDFEDILEFNMIEKGILPREYIFEEAIYTRSQKNPVYIVLMHSGTPLANIIKGATGDMWSHACIAFNSKLDPLYSFGSKGKGDIGLGFSVSDPKDSFFTKYHAQYSVYVMYVTDRAYKAMKDRLKFFQQNSKTLKYDVLGLVDIFFGLQSEKHADKYFCSRFVMELISKAQVLSKVPSLWKPQDIEDLDNISLVNKGFDFFNYNRKVTDKHCAAIKNGTYKEKDVIFESDIVNDVEDDEDNDELEEKVKFYKNPMKSFKANNTRLKNKMIKVGNYSHILDQKPPKPQQPKNKK